MDLEKAYNKIDNLCCLNHNSITIANMSIDKGIVPDKLDFFEGYDETKDDDFCKDTNEMIEALEIIKNLVDLQKEIGCPLDVFFKAFNGIYIIDDWHQLYFAKPAFINGNFKIEQHYGVYDVATYYLDPKDYGKTWWLEADKSL